MARRMGDDELKALASAGKVETLDGKAVKVLAFKPKTITKMHQAEDQPANQNSLASILATSLGDAIKASRESTEKIVAELQASRGVSLVEIQKPMGPIHEHPAPITKWKFTVDRDPNNGLIREIVAIAVEE
jgi:hypothetical protein